MGWKIVTILDVVLVILRLTATSTSSLSLTKDGCQEKCGNVNIPYPFGLGNDPKCFRDSDFRFVCNTSFGSPVLRDSKGGNIAFLNISLQGQTTVHIRIGMDCYNSSGRISVRPPKVPITLANLFSFSSTRNKFTAIGCDTIAYMSSSSSSGHSFTSGCISFCSSMETLINGSCSGIGCCQTAIPNGLDTFNVSLSSFYNHSYSLDFNPCSYAFLADRDWFNNFNLSSSDLTNLPKRLPLRYDNATVTPVVLDWVIPNNNCSHAIKNLTSYACRENTDCSDSSNPAGGYNCYCKKGYRGNPYLPQPQGCQDIDECKEDNNCTHICTNTLGSYSCSCPKGTHGDGLKGGSDTGCIKNQSRVVEIALGGGSCVLLFVIIGITWCCWVSQKRKLKQKFFQENGGVFLKQLLALHGDDSERKLKIFTSEELRKATNNYNESRIVGKGGYGTVYKGTLLDERDIAIKISKETNKIQVKEFIIEIVILDRLNHENVVKLLGCCLDSPVPILVYEFITRGTLFHRIHGDGRQKFVFSWEDRLRIAAEIAGALAYLHSANDPPIIHGDVKSMNILLDDKFTAKVSDFGALKLVPLNQMQLSTLVQGTLGYLDPEYMQTGQLTDKSDVYSFGAVLVELLTEKMIYSNDKPEEWKNMAKYFVSSMKQNRLLDILEDEVMNGGNHTQLQGVAELAERCLQLNGEERPTMREVVEALDHLRGCGVGKHPWVVKEKYDEESVHLLLESSLNSQIESSTMGIDSLKNEVILSLDDAR